MEKDTRMIPNGLYDINLQGIFESAHAAIIVYYTANELKYYCMVAGILG